jgi:NADPH-dependent 2,4-dienoyl-CoA reductase/sulfur reductase-like enzyme/rhodanese-related sulfurtransferase
MQQHIVIIGAVSLGPKVAARLKRLDTDSTVTIVDQENIVSYSCGGIPLFLSGDINMVDGLIQNNFQTLRDEKYYKEVLDVTLMRNTRAIKVDRQKKEVFVQNLLNGKQDVLPYDKLVMATGKRPKPFSVPDADLQGVLDVYSLKNADAVKKRILNPGAERAVIIGGGFTGLETAQALSEMWEIETTVVEIADQLLPHYFSPNMARAVKRHVEEKGVTVYLEEEVLRLEGNGSVEKVITSKRTLEAELVILATGVEPNSDLAKETGLEISPRGAIIVNRRMETSDPSIYAGGDCVEIPDLVTQKPGYFPWPSLAQRQGRVIGTNLGGGNAEFRGAVGNFAAKFFDKSFACAGLSIRAAQREGFDALNITVAQLERAHFWPVKDFMFLDLVVEKGTQRVLGIQGMGDSGDGLVGRVNTVAALLETRPTASEIGNLEIAYAPQFSGAMDIVNTLGNAAENVLLGQGYVMSSDEFKELWQDMNKNNCVVLDTRYSSEAEPFVNRYPEIWKNISLTDLLARKDDVPRDKKLVVLCKTGERSYDTHVVLNHMGIKDNYNLQGGVLYLQRLGLVTEDAEVTVGD